mmetsp:Transcript_20647/g.23884  ORF Transcript_20647/g.23884 Transcript_20647/m.23884 type:complete len:86 (+) Transcript_20647:94-351(+)|eukprot:CAMPEP_0168332324 /NCGR_PEP_ID=MMETSP0213-20121227/8892_1 /TAXON_ID=151035 /ORGANISM="Euplotes harpa, Strain FSP1.4" /LENGTH=85 /DNA_ID=CAMNT_0008336331 /DNA_START=88 /DNA_END=345 /DNA_ORIENTATION=+
MVEHEKSTIRKPKFEPADFIFDNIYLGSENSAINLEYLKEKNITHILTVAQHCTTYFDEEKDEIKQLVIEVDDSPDEDLLKHLKA